MQCAPPAHTRSRHLWQIHADRQECPWQVTAESTEKPASTDTAVSSTTELEAAQKDETTSKTSKPVEGEPAPMETSKPVEGEPAAEISKPVEGKPAAEKRALDETENADQNVPPQKKQSPGVQGKTEPVISAQDAATASEC